MIGYAYGCTEYQEINCSVGKEINRDPGVLALQNFTGLGLNGGIDRY